MPLFFAGESGWHRRRWAALFAPALLLLLTCIALLLGSIQATPGFRLRVDDPDILRYLVQVFPLERNDSETYRWSQGQFGIYLYGFDGRAALVSLRMTSPRPEGVATPQLTSPTLQSDLGELPSGRGWVRYHLLVPTAAYGETALLFHVPPFQPRNDPRPLGVALADIAAQPTAERFFLPPLVRSIFLLSLPLILWLLVLRLTGRRGWAWGVGLLAVPVMGWASANPTLASYLLPTLGWPWWPLLPLLGLIFTLQIAEGLRASRAWITARPRFAWAWLGVALGCLVAMRAGLPWPVGMLGLGLGVWVGSSALREGETEVRVTPIILLLIVGVSLGLRLVNLDGQPLALWRDEARHGLQALKIWNDPAYRPVYVAEGADLPALLFYLMAPVLGLLGPQVWTVRLVSALIGGLTPLALYWAARPLIGRRPALLAAALLACSSWALSMSRWAFPATLDHLLTLTAVGFAWRGLDPAANWRRSSLLLGMAGLCAGFATYAYHTGRVAPLALALLVLVRLGLDRRAWLRALPGLLVAATVGLLTMAPLLNYILHNYADYNRRVSQVAILKSDYLDTHTPLGLVLENTGRYLLMWHVQGELNGRHHMPDVPMVDPVLGLLMLLGLGLALRRPYQPQRLALLVIPAVYLLPAVFSTDAPHAMRALGMLAPACMLAGLALDHLFLQPQRRAGYLRAALVLLLSLGMNSWLYFGQMRIDARVYGEFDLVETALGQALQAPYRSHDPELQAVQVYTPDKFLATDTVRFLGYGLPLYAYTGDRLPSDGPILLLLPVTASPVAQAAALEALGPAGRRLPHQPYEPDGATPILLVFGRGAAAERLAAQLWP
ncbi:ArnT family glycosyltransferase [Candidatus Oscillochloris fontis]|uniref:ArnT family glycosyltransferase n=1 Tax=Candidatus Oscillochloris fontis TaxID=2496868 RepID=UPI00101DF455|nr:glycosyltransferase family 39 protein [Candidatus Oscillochloris fontis]